MAKKITGKPRLRIALVLVAVLLAFLVLQIAGSYNSIRVVRSQVIASYNDLVSLSVAQLDENLGDIEDYLMNLLYADHNFGILKNSPDSDDAAFAAVRLQSSLEATLAVNTTATALFAFSPESGRWLDAYRPESTFYEREALRDMLKSSLQGAVSLNTSTWFTLGVGADAYLMRIIPAGGMYIGAWSNIRYLQQPMQTINGGSGGAILFATSDGGFAEPPPFDTPAPMDATQVRDATGRYYLTRAASEKADLMLVAVLSEKEVLDNLPQRLWIQIAALLLALLLIPLLVWYFDKTIARPLDGLITAMRRFGSGEEGVRIDTGGYTGEFLLLAEEFNQMAAHISTLQRDVESQQALRQKAELQHLQLQINPHFFLNSLNLINSFLTTGRQDEAGEMIAHLMRYFRHMFKPSLAFISLGEELGHVENYMQIQSLRYGGAVRLVLDVPEILHSIQVPVLVLHTFVENTVKYGLRAHETTRIHITAELDVGAGRPALRLTVQDNGPGYTQAVLHRLREGGVVVDSEGQEHIGIWNLRKRMELLYGGKAEVSLYNKAGDETGAAARLLLPIPTEEST